MHYQIKDGKDIKFSRHTKAILKHGLTTGQPVQRKNAQMHTWDISGIDTDLVTDLDANFAWIHGPNNETGIEKSGRVKPEKKTQHATPEQQLRVPTGTYGKETGIKMGKRAKKSEKEGKDPKCDRKQQSYANKALNTRGLP
ncbi:hypothetical protein DFH29DRAFT_884024 [Suillus ampliporus]|nr:hypothetical protein DFH29DRAFT_884024 [Suillus ampliporus]